MRVTGIVALVAAAAVPVVAQVPTVRDQIPLAEVTRVVEYLEVNGLPKWFQKPVGAVDHISFTTICIAESADDACVDAADKAKREVRNILLEHLLPTLGMKDTMALLDPLVAATSLVSAELGTITVDRDADSMEERSLACLGWRAPVRKIIAKFEPKQQGRIEWALLRPVVHWRPALQPPAWASKVPKRAGYLRCAFRHTCTNARASAIEAAQRDVHSHLVDLLTPAVGKQRATRAASAGVQRLGAVARVHRVLERAQFGWATKVEAYCLWEVPLAPMLLTLPEGLRKVAEYQLQQPD